MKYVYQSILILIVSMTSMPVLSYKYIFYNKTDVPLQVNMTIGFPFYQEKRKSFLMIPNSEQRVESFNFNPGEKKTVDTDSGLCLREVAIIDYGDNPKYEKIYDTSMVARCYNKKWDIVVVKNNKGFSTLDLVDHSHKNESPVYAGKPARSIIIGQ